MRYYIWERYKIVRKRKSPTPTKYIQANFTECDGIDLLSVFLRQGQRLFPNFSSNEKRTIYDGDLDYLNKNKEIIKVFRCQVKSVKSTRGTFKIDYKYLLACSNKVSFDPLFFFLIDIHNADKPRFFYLNLTIFRPDVVSQCVKNKQSLTVKISDFKELSTAQDLIDDIEKNYLYTLSLSELSLEELRILMSGITYLNNCINRIPIIRNFMFPNFYSFVAEYEKNTNEGVSSGLYALEHDVLSIMPTIIDSTSDLIAKFNPTILRGKFISRSFDKNAISEDAFKEYLSYVLKEAFYFSEHLLEIMPEVVLHEIIYATINFEVIKIGNKKLKPLCELETIPLKDIKSIKLDENNLYKRHFDIAVKLCEERQIKTIRKVWHYWFNDDVIDDEPFNNDVRMFFNTYSYFVNPVLNNLLNENIDERAFYFCFERVNNTKILILNLISKNKFEYLDKEDIRCKENNGIRKGGCFENMNSFAPLFNTLLNKCYQVTCTKFECKCDNSVSVDGTKIYVP